MSRIGLFILFYFILFILFYFILLYVARLLTLFIFLFYSFYFRFYRLTRELGVVDQLSLRHVHSKKVRKYFWREKGINVATYIWKEEILHGKGETFWFSKRKGSKRKESGFPSWNWVFGRLIQIQKRRGLQKEKKMERGDFPFWNRFGFWGLIYIREKGCWRRGDFGIVLRKSTKKRERSDCSQGSSRCIPGYSRNSFSCSISPCVCFRIFNILLVGVDVKGHKLFCWDLLFTSLPYFDSDCFMCHGCL